MSPTATKITNLSTHSICYQHSAFVERLHRGHLVLAVGVVCRCTRPNIGWKARYAVRGDGPGCFHTAQTRRRVDGTCPGEPSALCSPRLCVSASQTTEAESPFR